jgi:hypothetical protein
MSAPPRDSLPTILPAVLAAIVERAPPRLVKKLDGAPEVAGGWTFEQQSNALSVTSDGGERVLVSSEDDTVRAPEQLVCSCLLAPKCFHLLAVAAYLPIAAEGESLAAAATPVPRDIIVPAMALDSERRQVARSALDVLAVVLESGLSAMGAQARAELLRSVHAARVHGLHRLASRTLSVAESGRALRERSASFELEQAVRALGEASLTAHQLANGSTSPESIGVARRSYEDVGAKRLMGVACEPVLTRSGYAGVVTYVVDEAGTLFTVQDVAPGDAGRALGSYRATVRLGDASLTHAELARQGLFVQGATASLDHRLGAGARVSAVSAAGARFDEPRFSALFAVPFATQLEHALAAAEAPDMRAPALLFLEGVLVGPDAAGALFIVGAAEQATLLTLAMPTSEASFACNENLRLLRAAVGTRLRVIGKIARRRPGVVELLAIGDVEGSLSVSPPSMGRVQVAFDTLARGQLRGDPTQVDAAAVSSAMRAESNDATDPIASLERRVGRMVLGGRRSLTTSASRDVALEANTLASAMLPTTRRVLEELLVAAATSGRPTEARRRLLEAWLRAYVTSTTLRRTLAGAAWGAR